MALLNFGHFVDGSVLTSSIVDTNAAETMVETVERENAEEK